MSGLPIGSDLSHLQEFIRHRIEQMETLYTLSLDIFSARSIEELLIDVMERVTQAMKADRSTLFMLDAENHVLWSKVAQKTDPILLPIGKGLAGWVAESGETLNIEDAYQDARFCPDVDLRTGYHTHSVLCMPVRSRAGEMIAVIQVINKKLPPGMSALSPIPPHPAVFGSFSPEDVDFLRALSAHIQLAIENATLYDDLRKLFESTMEAMASTIDARHPNTAGHTSRVRSFSLAIAEEMGFSANDLEILNYAALLHDYGKIGIPEAILTKPGKLTAEEYTTMKRHVVFTQDILSKIRFSPRFREIPEIASHHHERVDGTGYPDGLTGDQMHPLSKIMAVADVFDAMTSVRDYRSPSDPEDVLKMLKEESGTHFDPPTVSAFERYFHRTDLADQIRRRNQNPDVSVPLSSTEPAKVLS